MKVVIITQCLVVLKTLGVSVIVLIWKRAHETFSFFLVFRRNKAICLTLPMTEFFGWTLHLNYAECQSLNRYS